MHGGLPVAELHGKSFPESLEKTDNFELSDDLDEDVASGFVQR